MCFFYSFLYNNKVTVVLFTAIFWIPASTTISYVDRKKRRNDAKEYKWNQSFDLIHPSDRRRVIHIRFVIFFFFLYFYSFKNGYSFYCLPFLISMCYIDECKYKLNIFSYFVFILSHSFFHS